MEEAGEEAVACGQISSVITLTGESPVGSLRLVLEAHC